MILRKPRSPFLAMASCAAFLLAAKAEADWFGSTVAWQYYAFGGPYTFEGETSGTFVVDGGIGGTFIGGSDYLYFNIVADATSLTFDYSIATGVDEWDSSELSLPPTIHNGIAIDVVSGPALAEVTINPATNMTGFDASRISFTANQIQVDWENLGFVTSTIVRLDVVTVPEPGSVILFGSCLAAIAVRRRATRTRVVESSRSRVSATLVG